MNVVIKSLSLVAVAVVAFRATEDWPAPKSIAIPEADGYVAIPGAVIAPDPSVVYRVVLDATRAASKPDALVPAVNAAGNLLNDFAGGGVPDRNAKLVVVFHGDALTGILDDAHYLAKLGVHNPNLPVLSALKKHGVELYVCGQNLAAEKIDPKTLSPDVTLASDAWLVLITYQNKGHALMSF